MPAVRGPGRPFKFDKQIGPAFARYKYSRFTVSKTVKLGVQPGIGINDLATYLGIYHKD